MDKEIIEKDIEEKTADKFVSSGELTIKSTEERIITFVATTDSVDRDNERIIPAGLKYNLKQLSLYDSHDNRKDIGTIIDIYLTPDKKQLIATAKIMDAGTNPESDIIWEKIKQGVRTVFSIGFRILKTRVPSKKDREEFGDYYRTINKGELMEVSSVGVAAQPEAELLEWKNTEVIENKELEVISAEKEIKEGIVETKEEVIKDVDIVMEEKSAQDILIEKIKKELRVEIENREVEKSIKEELSKYVSYRDGNLYW